MHKSAEHRPRWLRVAFRLAQVYVPLNASGLRFLVERDLGPGSLVLLPPGIFWVGRPLVPSSHTDILGFGILSIVTLRRGSNCHIFSNRNKEGVEGIRIRFITLIGRRGRQKKPPDSKYLTWSCGFYFWKVRDVLVENVLFFDIAQTGIQLFECDSVLVRRCFGSRFGWSGLATTRTSNICLSDSIFSRTGLAERHSAVHFDGGSEIEVRKLKVKISSGNGLMLDSNNGDLYEVRTDSYAEDCLRGLSLSGSREHLISNVKSTFEAENCHVGVLVSHSKFVELEARVTGSAVAAIVQGERSEGIRFKSFEFERCSEQLQVLHGAQPKDVLFDD